VSAWPLPTHGTRDARQHVAAAVAEMKVDEERAKAAAKVVAAAAGEAAGGAAERGDSGAVAAAGGGSGGGTGSSAAVPPPGCFIDPGTLAPCAASDPGGGGRRFSAWEVNRLLLRSKAVCAWNECHHHT
jgi:hypothetical protein